jgi:hypothetical protein
MWELDGTLSNQERATEFARLTLRRNAGLSGPVGEADVQRAIQERISYETARKMAIYPPDLVTEARTYRGSGGAKLENVRVPADRTPFVVTVYVPKTKVT